MLLANINVPPEPNYCWELGVMSLLVSLDINRVGTGAGLIAIQRIEGSAAPDSNGLYEYTIWDDPNDDRFIARGQVRHRYGDGALILLKRVMDAWKEPNV